MLKDFKLDKKGWMRLLKVGGFILLASYLVVGAFEWMGYSPKLSRISGVKSDSVVVGLDTFDGNYEDDYDTKSIAPSELSLIGDTELGYVDQGGFVKADQQSIQKNGYYSITVIDLDTSRKDVETVASRMGGYVDSLSESGTGNNRKTSLTIKVPVRRFEVAMKEVRTIAEEVVESKVYTDDVTDQVVDTKARLVNEEAYEAQLVTLLDKANTVKEILAVQSELTQVRGNIERMKAQLDYLERTTEYSTISVTMTIYQDATEIVESKYSVVGVFKDALRSLLELGEAALSVLIWFVVYIPAIVVVSLLVWAATASKRYFMNIRKGSKK